MRRKEKRKRRKGGRRRGGRGDQEEDIWSPPSSSSSPSPLPPSPWVPTGFALSPESGREESAMGWGPGHRERDRKPEERYLKNVGEVPEVEDVMKLNGRGKKRRCDFLM